MRSNLVSLVEAKKKEAEDLIKKIEAFIVDSNLNSSGGQRSKISY
jgi:hypothetical protein